MARQLYDSDGLTFDYTTPDYVRLPYMSAADLLKDNNPFTLFYGFKVNTLPSSAGANMSMFHQANGTGTGKYWLMMHSSDNKIATHLLGGIVKTSAALTAGTWYLTVLRYDGTTLETFTNDVAYDTITGSPDLGADGDYYIPIKEDLTIPADITMDLLLGIQRKVTDTELTEVYNWFRGRQ